MRTAVLALAVVVGPCWLARAADLEKVDRRVVPPARWAAPVQHFALLASGADAARRAWIVVDGDDLYVDRDFDGALEDEEKVGAQVTPGASRPSPGSFETSVREWNPPDLAGAWTEMKVELNVLNRDWLPKEDHPSRTEMAAFMAAVREDPHANLVAVSLKDSAGRDRLCSTRFAADPESAPVMHLDGPLTMGVVESSYLPFEFWLGTERKLSVALGTPGRGPGTFAYMLYTGIDKDLKPTVEIAFPGRTAGSTLDLVKTELLDRC